jgi:hypothetical protein
MNIDVDTLTGESASADFKSSFDPQSKQDWCELIKDIIAMSNSGGGLIIVGADDDGKPLADMDVAPLLAVDPADVTNRIHSYTDQHFAAFEITQGIRQGEPVALIDVGPSDIPIVFTAHGGYAIPGGQKTAFVKGSVYFRHGAKSEPGTTDDLRQALERKLAQVKGFWLDGIGKVMAAPPGSDVQIVQRAITLKDSEDAMAVRLTIDGGAPAIGASNVALRDATDALPIRLTNDESAPTLSVVQADRLYPHRQKELVKRLAERIGGKPLIGPHDLQCVRRVHEIDDNPMFTYQAQHSPRKYTEAFVDWLLSKYAEDPHFFKQARELVRMRNLGFTGKEVA